MRYSRFFLALVFALGTSPVRSQSEDSIHKIRHIVIIMQENRSFDSYFGTFPGADGIAMSNGVPTVCVPAPAGACVRPFHDSADLNRGGPHNVRAAITDVDAGRMDGFVTAAQRRRRGVCRDPNAPNCGGTIEVMGYHDGRELANYWRYAHDFVLQDRLFEQNASWSLPQHLFMVSGWSAWCKQIGNPMSCVNEPESPDFPPDFRSSSPRFKPPAPGVPTTHGRI